MLIINVKPNKGNDVPTPIVLKWVYFNLPNRSFHACFTTASLPSGLPSHSGHTVLLQMAFPVPHLVVVLLKKCNILFAFLAGACNRRSRSHCPPGKPECQG